MTDLGNGMYMGDGPLFPDSMPPGWRTPEPVLGMGKGSKRRPGDEAALERNWPFPDPRKKPKPEPAPAPPKKRCPETMPDPRSLGWNNW